MRSDLFSKRAALATAAAAVVLAAAGCGASSAPSAPSSAGGDTQTGTAPNPNAPEVNPAGDIPDNQVYVRYAPPGGGFSVKVPEGWSRTSTGGATTFTDKLNAVTIETTPARAALTTSAARHTVVPKLSASVRGFKGGVVDTVSRSAGPAVRIRYRATSKPDPVTGKTRTDAVERYVFFHNGRDLVLTLSGPKGADNVDPWHIVTDSVRWSR